MRANDLTGRRFGKLTALEKVEGGSSRWLCRCDCGNEKVVYATNLVSGKATTCGCWKNTVNGESHTKLYRVYKQMVQAGICSDEWTEYKVFKGWAIENGWQEGMRFSRPDKNAPFGPDNCIVRAKGSVSMTRI